MGHLALEGGLLKRSAIVGAGYLGNVDILWCKSSVTVLQNKLAQCFVSPVSFILSSPLVTCSIRTRLKVTPSMLHNVNGDLFHFVRRELHRLISLLCGSDVVKR